MKALLMAACLCCTVSLQAGEVYKWTDEGGRVHYSDTVPPARKATAQPVDTSSAVVADTPPRRPATRAAPKKEPIFSERPAPPPPPTAASAPQTPAAASSCEEAWRRFNESYACFDPYRMAGGRVRPEAYQHCVEVPRPDACP
jgi:hypothetical protein